MCHLTISRIGGVASAGRMLVLVFGGGVSRILARSSAFSNTLASLIHSKKLDPSDFRGSNIKACILNSIKLAFVDIVSILVYMLSIG